MAAAFTHAVALFRDECLYLACHGCALSYPLAQCVGGEVAWRIPQTLTHRLKDERRPNQVRKGSNMSGAAIFYPHENKLLAACASNRQGYDQFYQDVMTINCNLWD
jgi:hypothetical protein